MGPPRRRAVVATIRSTMIARASGSDGEGRDGGGEHEKRCHPDRLAGAEAQRGCSLSGDEHGTSGARPASGS
ncbi:MAG: hypothetical protein ACTHQQ_21300 [Solirubrobacteraceae bacterium]